MSQISIAYTGAPARTGNRIILLPKTNPAIVDALLSPDEQRLLRQFIERGVKYCYLHRSDGLVWLRWMQDTADPVAGLEEYRNAGHDILGQLRHFKVDGVGVEGFGIEPQQLLAFAEGMALGAYRFTRFFSDPGQQEFPLRQIHLAMDGLSRAEVEELDNLVGAVFLARDLVNAPQSHLTAPELARAASVAGQTFGFSVEVLGKEKLESLKMGGLLAVNRGSELPPQFCILEWHPDNACNGQPVILVGKGVVYDTGGLSLKTSEGMETMKCDMAGAAAVIGSIAAAARNKLPVHLIGLIPITDNKVNDRAIAPGDVIRMYSGASVEVVNTDAEGRLILADALHYAKKFRPELVVDLATLTGAAVRALGAQAICYMGTAPQSVKSQLESAGWQCYERLVELPLWKEYREELKSNIADLRNIGSANAGMITAGKFLEHFTDYPWLHLDIAGPAYLRQANTYRPREGTGVGVRLLYQFLKNRCQG